jgi:uncharacterized low-complexity protein
MLSGSAFASTPLAQGYLLGAQEAAPVDKAKEGSCGADKAKEGKCGVAAMDSDKDGMVSRAEFEAAHADKAGMEGKCGEGKCGGM